MMTWKRFHPLDALLLVFVHVMAVCAVWHMVIVGFSVTAWAAFGLTWTMSLLGVSVYYHRCKTHQAFVCRRKWFEVILASCGAVGLVRSAKKFCEGHAQHHTYTDKPGDPHSPTEFGGGPLGFWWAYILCTVFDPVSPIPGYHPPRRFAEDPVLIWQDRYFFPLAIGLGFVLPFLITGLVDMHHGSHPQGFLMAGYYGLLLQFLRQIFTWHPAFMVNSVGHRFGSRAVRDSEAPEDAPEKYFDTHKARNFPLLSFCGILGIFTGGESYHANHHARATCAYLGWNPSDIDPGKYAIWLFEKMGLVEKVVKPPQTRTTLPDAA